VTCEQVKRPDSCDVNGIRSRLVQSLPDINEATQVEKRVYREERTVFVEQALLAATQNLRNT
jgi:hypothetical protein